MNDIIKVQAAIVMLEANGCWATAKVLREWLDEMVRAYENRVSKIAA